MYRLLTFILGYSVIAALGISLAVPYFLEWYANPSAPIGINCSSTAQWAMDVMLASQLSALAAGGFLGLIFSIILKKKAKIKAATTEEKPKET